MDPEPECVLCGDPIGEEGGFTRLSAVEVKDGKLLDATWSRPLCPKCVAAEQAAAGAEQKS